MFEVEAIDTSIDTVLDLYNIIEEDIVLDFLKTGMSTIIELENMTLGLYQFKKTGERQAFILRKGTVEERTKTMDDFFDGLDNGTLRRVQ